MPGQVVTRDEWLAARKDLLAKEKALTQAADALNAERRSLPMVEITKPYTFTGPGNTKHTLSDLFADKDQLIVYHFMYGPDSNKVCNGCTHVGESIPNVAHLRSKNVNMVSVSRAPMEKLQEYKEKQGWDWDWYSADGDFNFDFNATLDEDVKPVELNFRNQDELDKAGKKAWKGDVPGYSVFLKQDGAIYHTYSTWERGLERTLPTLMLLDMTPMGRGVMPNGPGDFKPGGIYE
ncbi:hypothetical protein Golomagni_07910 [Golovinomyces magnicellulatus]|nr:hypothetical protein Golomagni_07910 [Golovinomyces magnicellulatus]